MRRTEKKGGDNPGKGPMKKGGCHYYHVKKEGEAVHIQNEREGERERDANRIKSIVVHGLTFWLSFCASLCLKVSQGMIVNFCVDMVTEREGKREVGGEHDPPFVYTGTI